MSTAFLLFVAWFHFFMAVAVARLAETLPAQVALVRLFCRVNSQVVFHIGKLREMKVAVVTMELLAHPICIKIHIFNNPVMFHLNYYRLSHHAFRYFQWQRVDVIWLPIGSNLGLHFENLQNARFNFFGSYSFRLADSAGKFGVDSIWVLRKIKLDSGLSTLNNGLNYAWNSAINSFYLGFWVSIDIVH